MQMETRARTPFFFQMTLVEEMKEITSDMRFKMPRGTNLVPISVFPQALPIPQRADSPPDTPEDGGTINYVDGEEEEAIFKCPWCVVKIESGSVPEINGNQRIKAAVCFGIFNDSPDNKGHTEILNLIQRVYERFAKNPLLAGQYTYAGGFEWGLQDEDTHPYFFGAAVMDFEFQGIRRENRYS